MTKATIATAKTQHVITITMGKMTRTIPTIAETMTTATSRLQCDRDGYRYIPLRCVTSVLPHHPLPVPFRYIPLHRKLRNISQIQQARDIPLHFVTFRYIVDPSPNSNHYIPLHPVTSGYIPLHTVALVIELVVEHP